MLSISRNTDYREIFIYYNMFQRSNVIQKRYKKYTTSTLKILLSKIALKFLVFKNIVAYSTFKLYEDYK